MRAHDSFGAVVGLSRADGFDYAHPEAARGALRALEGPFDRVIIATGALEAGGHAPEKSLRALTPHALAAQFAVNTIGPAMVLAEAPRLLPSARPSGMFTLSARVGSIGDNHLGGWHSYRAAKAALNQLVHGAAIELARSHPSAICAALHPGTVATALTQTHGKGHPKVTPDVAAANLIRVMERLTPQDTGGFFDWQGARIPW